MTFLVPGALALAAAAIVPLLLHLWRRRAGRHVEFPGVRYLARAEREHSRRLRLRNLALMIARIAVLGLLALAAARPVARVASGRGPTGLAIVLDNSMSSALAAGGRTVFSALAGAARRTLDQLTADDRVWLVTADGRIAAGTVADVARALDAVEPRAGAGDLERAMSLAREAVRTAPDREPAILVLTDGQRSSWRAVAAPRGGSVAVHRPAPPAAARNRAVVFAAARPRRWLPRGALVGRALTADSVAYRVTLRDAEGAERTLARGIVGPEGDILVGAAPRERGWIGGAIELEPDELRLDDRRWFATWSGALPRVDVRPGAGPFVSRALAVLADDGRIGLASGGITVAGAESGVRRPALLFAPRDPVAAGAANRALAAAGIPWRLESPVAREEPVRGPGLEGVESRRRYELRPLDGSRADTLATAGGQAWIVAGPDWVLVASAADTAATTLPVRASFLPWLVDIIGQRLSPGGGAIIEAVPGERLALPAGVVAMRSGDARMAVAAGGMAEAPAQPGAWLLISEDGHSLGMIVVNPDTSESRLDWMTDTELARAAGGPIEASAERAIDVALDVGGRRPLDAWLIAGAALLLALEMALAADRVAARIGEPHAAGSVPAGDTG